MVHSSLRLLTVTCLSLCLIGVQAQGADEDSKGAVKFESTVGGAKGQEAHDGNHSVGNHATQTNIKFGDFLIQSPVIRATPPSAPVSAGYMVIKNKGTVSDTLLRASADFAGKVELHDMTMQGDVMKMREMADGVEIPPGGEVVFKPGGKHLMFMKLEEQLKPGQKRKVVLEFKNAGRILMTLPVDVVKRGHGNH